MVRIRAHLRSFQPRSALQSIFEPLAMHAVARTIQVASGDALVRLPEIEMSAQPCFARRAREARIAPQATDIWRIDPQDASGAFLAPFARDQRNLRAELLERCERAFDEPFGATEGVVALPDQRDALASGHTGAAAWAQDTPACRAAAADRAQSMRSSAIRPNVRPGSGYTA